MEVCRNRLTNNTASPSIRFDPTGCSALIAPLPPVLDAYLHDVRAFADAEGSPYFMIGGHALMSIRAGSPVTYYDADKRFPVWSDSDMDFYVVVPNKTYLQECWVQNVWGPIKQKWPGIHVSKTDLKKHNTVHVWHNPGYPGRGQKTLEPGHRSPTCAASLSFQAVYIHNETHLVRGAVAGQFKNMLHAHYAPRSLYLPVRYAQYGLSLQLPVAHASLYQSTGEFRDFLSGNIAAMEGNEGKQGGESRGAIGCRRASYPDWLFSVMDKLNTTSNCKTKSLLKCQRCPTDLNQATWFRREELRIHFATCAQSLYDQGLASYSECVPQLIGGGAWR